MQKCKFNICFEWCKGHCHICELPNNICVDYQEMYCTVCYKTFCWNPIRKCGIKCKTCQKKCCLKCKKNKQCKTH